jgi:hypothetical protein
MTRSTTSHSAAVKARPGSRWMLFANTYLVTVLNPSKLQSD